MAVAVHRDALLERLLLRKAVDEAGEGAEAAAENAGGREAASGSKVA